MINYLKKYLNKYSTIIKFSMVGVTNTLISEGIYAILILCKWNYLLAYILGQLLSVLNAFILNNRFVFCEDKNKEKRVWWKVLTKTYIAYGGTFVLSFILLFVWVDLVRIERWCGPLSMWLEQVFSISMDNGTIGKLLAEGINLVMTIPINYFVNKYWAFRQKEKNVQNISKEAVTK